MTITKRNESIELLQKFEYFFNRTLGTYKTDTVYFELREDANPICLQPYS